MYAVIASGGKQNKVEVGSRVELELLGVEVGETVQFTPVLVVDGESVVAEQAALGAATVSGRVVGASAGPKITGFTYKSKSRSRRRFGHRQHYSTVEITEIVAAGKPSTARAAAKA